LAWRRKAVAAGDEHELAQTEELLRNCSEEEALRIVQWVGARCRKLAFATSVSVVVVGVAFMALGDFVARAVGWRAPHHVAAHFGAIVAGGILVVWLARSPTARRVRRALEALALVPWKSARIALLNEAPSSLLGNLLEDMPDVARLLEKELSEGDPPILSRRAAIRWLRHVKEQYVSAEPGDETAFAEAVLREAAGHSESILVRRLVAGLARKTGGNTAQIDIARAARKTLAGFGSGSTRAEAQETEAPSP
jgi:hypothetical protein